MQHPTVVVVGGGGPVRTDARAVVPDGTPVVAADGGVDVALALGLRIDVAVGDFDSVTADGLATAEAGGSRIERHPVDKDATDLALALDVAAAMVDVDGEIVVVGTDAGRLDHLLAGVLALASPSLPPVRAYLGPATLHVVRGPGEVRFDAAPGELVSLVPVGGDAAGVRTDGLAFSLRRETLPVGTTRGVSNVVEPGGSVVVGLDVGCLLVVLPGERA